MTVYSDNPAGRLHELITLFRRNASTSTIPQAWAAALGIRDLNSPDLLRRLAHVFRLPAEIQAELDQVDEDEFDSDLALRWQATIPQGLGPALFTGQQSAQLVPKFDDASLSSLEHCSYVLHRYRRQRVLSDSELDRIRKAIVELEAEVRSQPGLDASLRDFLLYHAGAMARALEDLAVRGPAALEEALDQAMGAAYRRVDLTADKDSPGVWAKFGNLIVVVAAVLQIATSSFVLPGQIRQELEGPPPAQPVVVRVVEEPVQGPTPSAPNGQKHIEYIAESSGSR